MSETRQQPSLPTQPQQQQPRPQPIPRPQSIVTQPVNPQQSANAPRPLPRTASSSIGTGTLPRNSTAITRNNSNGELQNSNGAITPPSTDGTLTRTQSGNLQSSGSIPPPSSNLQSSSGIVPPPSANSQKASVASPAAPIEIWPLRLIDFDDEDQFIVIYELLRKYDFLNAYVLLTHPRLPHVVYYYLDHYVFPVVLKHQSLKLSACGQELG